MTRKPQNQATVLAFTSADVRSFEMLEWVEPFDEDDPHHGFLHRRQAGACGLLIFTAEAEAAQDAGLVVLVVSRSKSGKTWVLRAAPQRGAGRPVPDAAGAVEIQLGSGPSVYRWAVEARDHHEPVDEVPPYVWALGRGTFDDAVRKARALAASWGIPAVIYDPERRHSRRGFTSQEAAEEHAMFERWYAKL